MILFDAGGASRKRSRSLPRSQKFRRAGIKSLPGIRQVMFEEYIRGAARSVRMWADVVTTNMCLGVAAILIRLSVTCQSEYGPLAAGQLCALLSAVLHSQVRAQKRTGRRPTRLGHKMKARPYNRVVASSKQPRQLCLASADAVVN